VKYLPLIASLILLGACSAEPGSEKWCAQKSEQPKSEWSMADATTYAGNCLIEGSAVGSSEWCEDMDDTPKGEWTANEASSYAKHCVI
jgi:hypothetical protein